MKKLFIVFMLVVNIRVSASLVVMDAGSGRVLYSEDKNERKLIASTTKIMTSIVALENASLSKKITIGDEIDKVNGSMIYAKKGEVFTLNDLLHGLMLRSGNDAAMSIASNVMNYDDFIMQMNLKAYKLGMYNTTFENPHGLNDDTCNYSTAYDLALLMKYAINNSDFLNITSTRKYKVGNYIWYNKNDLLGTYKYLISGKIGYTKKSGPVFVSAAKKDGKTLIVVSINESDKFNLHKNLYIKYFDMYNNYKIVDKDLFSFKIDNDNDVHYYIKNDFYMLLKKGEEKNIKLEANLNSNNSYLEVFYNGISLHKEKIYSLKYKERISRLKEFLSFFR